ncbi:hypothetical protein [Pontimicrobium sp. IMCC45349]|uniref:hypothetical protein n=1 Tax=Pontimicrobium sp. IMCC45349 TaxID=3391574 RepID=UPI0039A2D97F
MATQICPNCKKDNFTWYINYDGETVWGCSLCNYHAIENESLERTCSICKTKTESHLKDSQKEFWCCSRCNSIEIII